MSKWVWVCVAVWVLGCAVWAVHNLCSISYYQGRIDAADEIRQEFRHRR
jgi:bacteriorhodopsin